MPDTIVTSGPRGFWREIRQRPLAAAILALIQVSLVFLLAPACDLAVSRFFYVPGAGFTAGQNAAVEGLRKAGRMVEWAFGIATLLPLALKVLLPYRKLLLAPRATLFVLATFALGPWLLVNGVLKEFWGRARPRALLEFGGQSTFSPAWWISDQCDRNCSFVSGEAASAFCMVALVFLVRREQRAAVACVSLAFAATVSLTRIAEGGHFLSDVLIAWLLTLCVMIGLNELVMKKMPKAFDREVEDGAARFGLALRRPRRGRGRK
jgi:membrane-associated PAP2 superfamily phosphatase